MIEDSKLVLPVRPEIWRAVKANFADEAHMGQKLVEYLKFAFALVG